MGHAPARAQVLLAAVLFGTTGTAQALGPATSTPVTVGAGRVLVGGALLVVLALATGSLGGSWPVRYVLGLGVGVAIYQLAFFAAVDRTGVVVGTIVAIGSGPVFAGLFEWLGLGERPGARWGVATALACAGVVVLTTDSGGSAEVSAAGVGLALIGGAGYAFYAVTARHLLRSGHPPIGVMAAAFGTGALILLPVLALGETAWMRTPSGAALVLYLGVVPTAIAYVLYARGLQTLTAAETTTLTLAEPVTATILGAVVLDERVGVAGAVGCALVLAGLAVLAVRRPR